MNHQIVNFNEAANVQIRRSKFKMPSRHLTTLNAGELVPIYCQEVLPGDTFKMNTSMLIRSTTPLHPTMDNAFIDTFYFFVPTRLVWENWARFNGESDTAWAQDTVYSIPQVSTNNTAIQSGSIFDHFGVFPNNGVATTVTFNALPFRSYLKIWNDWFRDENLQDAIDIYLGDTEQNANSFNGVNLLTSSGILSSCKYHDYFTSALPKPQKGADVLIPATGAAPIYTMPLNNTVYNSAVKPYFQTFDTTLDGEKYDPINAPDNLSPGQRVAGSNFVYSLGSTTPPALAAGTSQTNYTQGIFNPGSSLYANLNVVNITVNNLRLAVQTQKLLEKDARGGTRYTEILRSHFGIISPDARLQRSEYLGGKHTPINMAEIAQTSGTQDVTESGTATINYLGDLAGYSSTAETGHDFTKSFVEHGYIIGLATIRTQHTYSQGVEKFWFKKNRLDFYWPVLANIGEQPIYKRELYCSGVSTIDNSVFGYQEAWAEYRYKPNSLSGAFRSDLISWTYADYYTSAPSLSSSWIKQGKVEVDRTLTLQSSIAPQYFGDFAFDLDAYRPMPIYSIPGYLDHF